MNEAATPTGGAEVSARPDASASPQVTWSGEKPSVHDRLKAFLNPTPAEPTQSVAKAPESTDSKAPPQEASEEAEATEQSEADAEVTTEDAETDEAAEDTYSSVDELAEALGWDLDKILDLEAKTKIDGKEGKTRLRDLIKSHQLEGHLNQKLMTFADEKKAFEAERSTKTREMADKLLKMDAGLQTLERSLAGEFAGVDWQALQTQDPSEFNAKYVAYQQRYAQLQAIGEQIAQEQAQHKSEMERQTRAYLDEQRKLLQAKVPEWSDESRRKKDFADMVPVLNKAYGWTKDELEGVNDHRLAMGMRDLAKYHQLIATKPVVLNKVKAAPKLLRPGATQSRAAQAGLQMKQDKDRLRSSGKVRDAKPILKQLLFN